jgi:galactokinase
MTRTYRAPGRVNLIGEHTDYNLGFVLPIALDLATFVTTRPTDDGHLTVHSEAHGETWDWPIRSVASLQPQRHWTDYVIGVARQLLQHGHALAPQHLSIRSTVPEGAGLSSSAALEVSTALAFLRDTPIDNLDLAKLCQSAERDFVGMPSGIMDQYISIFGRDHAAVMIDCRGLTHQLVELPDDLAIVAVNSMVKHELGQSAYRIRVEECAMASDALKVASLRDATIAQLESTPMPNVVMRRARHVITDNARVHLFVNAARRGDLRRMGELFYESHLSMQHDYEITCEEVDFLVQAAKGIEGVYGARMTGGGFGGCTVNLLRPDAVDRFRRDIVDRYEERFAIIPSIIPCIPSSGAGPENSEENFSRLRAPMV